MLLQFARHQMGKLHRLNPLTHGRTMHLAPWTVGLASACLAAILLGLNVHSVWAAPILHEAPEGSEWVMADWMFLSFLLFAGASFVAFLIALKSGLLSNIEDAKYYILEIDEEDYYTPAWAKTGDEG